jgi:acyl-coenzyme A synthetase/AMP-(fatty) acid ligase
VADAAVLVHDNAGAPVLVAFVVPAQGDQAANATGFARSLRPRLAALLPPQQVPTHIHAVPAIPLLPSLKPDLAALRTMMLGKKASGVIARVWTTLRHAASLSASAPTLPPVRRDDVPS